MKSKIVIGIDIGTTSTKTVAYQLNGDLWSESEKEYPLYVPDPTKKEQDPEEILEAVISTLSEVVQKVSSKDGHVIGVGFSSAMHSLLGVDDQGQPLTNVITWADQRAVQEVEDLKRSGEGHDIYIRTGTPLHPMSPLAKLIWFNNHESELTQKVQKWISIKEYVTYRLFHRYVVDYSIASATGLFHLKTLDWDEEALTLAQIREDQLSLPISTTSILTGMDPMYAEQIGLSVDTPFVIGASDGVLANLGVGAIQPGVVACSVGTSGAVRSVVDRPITDPEGRLFCYALTEDKWVIGGPINNGGIALQWLRDSIFPELVEKAGQQNPYDYLMKEASTVPVGSDGLLFLPYLLGERAPFWDAETKGVFFGLTLHHEKRHMIRSVLEGVMYQLQMVVRVMEEAGVTPVEIRANGGFARSNLWRQIMADIFNTSISFPENHQSACFGAACLTLKALGEMDNLDEVLPLVNITDRQTPVPEQASLYEQYKPLFYRLAHKLAPEFQNLSELNQRIKG
ncbi:gluconokinase [Radiobacillus kanasensis]|uniref:gluconokinase n=1 Tax=Radiobacillus kanasensis TaxID=2844358 RepID=UPI001E3BD06F|nr:gluconokinase [Radiobacillus kanasensis]UFT98594.1 gluconokinase [Radiobacillus kanasensis]